MNVAFFKTKLDIDTLANKCIELFSNHSIVGMPLSVYSDKEILEVIKRLGDTIDLVVSFPSQKEYPTYKLSSISLNEDDKFIYLLSTIKFVE